MTFVHSLLKVDDSNIKFMIKSISYIFTVIRESCKAGVLKWWVATQKWVAGPEFLGLDSMRAPKFRH
jgi:hypothetical protein